MKDEKQVQNETTEVTNSLAMNIANAMAELGLVPKETVVDNVEEASDFILIPDMLLERKITRKNNKEFNDYILHGKLRGVGVEIYVRPGKTSTGFTDVNAYNLLNIIFGTQNQACFAVRVVKRTDRQTQRVVTTLEYVAYAKDEELNSDLYCPLRFETSSDRAMLRQLLDRSNKKYNLNLSL